MIPTLSKALADKGYASLTPVQEAVTDGDLMTDDLLVSAQTGSGKTVAFGLALGPTLLEADGLLGSVGSPQALIIAPTRELAMQVKRELAWLYASTGARLASTVGGMDFRDERRTLERGADIVIATPGRLKDHILRGTIDLAAIKAIVLDEADEMLDLGFREDLEFILSEAPEERRTLMFSATVPPMIERLAQSYQRRAKRIVTNAVSDQHADISYQALQVAYHDIDNAIINVLRFHEAPNAIVFANTRAMVTRLTTRLSNRGFSVVALSGELTQSERSNALQAMRDGRARVCVATDVAARGIDLPKLELVVHAELPTNAETLMHRSGRTGRAGRKGVSAMIVPPKMRRRAENLLKWGKLDAEWTVPPSAEEVRARDEIRLLEDPLWQETPTEAETLFAERLMALHSPAQIAAAYLKLYMGSASAPEDLTPPDSKPARVPREHADFGPSRWFQINVGRSEKAEVRWLLPMICRAGDITKTEIGKIKVQEHDSLVEIRESAVDGFLASVGEKMVLENNAKLTAIEGTPDFERPPPRRPRKGHVVKDEQRIRPKTGSDKPEKEVASRSDKKTSKPKREKPTRRDGPESEPQKANKKPPHARTERSDKTQRPRREKTKGKHNEGRKRSEAKQQSRRDDASLSRSSKQSAPNKGKTKAAAADTSKRFTPPGKAPKPYKNKGKGTGKGGNATPRRQR